MKQVLTVFFALCLLACNNDAAVKAELDTTKRKLDTLVSKIENSATVDSIKAKGGKILDSVKSKGGRLIDKAEKRLGDGEKDSTN